MEERKIRWVFDSGFFLLPSFVRWTTHTDTKKTGGGEECKEEERLSFLLTVDTGTRGGRGSYSNVQETTLAFAWVHS